MNKIYQNIEIEKHFIINYCNYDSLIFKYKINTDNWGTPDFVAVSGSSKIAVEVKVRNYQSYKFDSLLIERMKFDKMLNFYIKHKNTTNYIPYYFNSFTDNKIFCFNLLPYFEGQKELKWVNESHYINSNKYNKKEKEIAYIPSSDVHLIHTLPFLNKVTI